MQSSSVEQFSTAPSFIEQFRAAMETLSDTEMTQLQTALHGAWGEQTSNQKIASRASVGFPRTLSNDATNNQVIMSEYFSDFSRVESRKVVSLISLYNKLPDSIRNLFEFEVQYELLSTIMNNKKINNASSHITVSSQSNEFDQNKSFILHNTRTNESIQLTLRNVTTDEAQWDILQKHSLIHYVRKHNDFMVVIEPAGPAIIQGLERMVTRRPNADTVDYIKSLLSICLQVAKIIKELTDQYLDLSSMLSSNWLLERESKTVRLASIDTLYPRSIVACTETLPLDTLSKQVSCICDVAKGDKLQAVLGDVKQLITNSHSIEEFISSLQAFTPTKLLELQKQSLEDLLNKIESLIGFGAQDKLMIDFLRDYSNKISALSSEEQYKTYKDKLTTMEKQCQRNATQLQFKLIKESRNSWFYQGATLATMEEQSRGGASLHLRTLINTYRNGWYYQGAAKAALIEEALHAIPIEERHQITNFTGAAPESIKYLHETLKVHRYRLFSKPARDEIEKSYTAPATAYTSFETQFK